MMISTPREKLQLTPLMKLRGPAQFLALVMTWTSGDWVLQAGYVGIQGGSCLYVGDVSQTDLASATWGW